MSVLQEIDMKQQEARTDHIKIWLLVIDVLKPHDPTILGIAKALNAITGVDGVEVIVHDINRRVEGAKITLEGPDIPYEKVKKVVHDHGATIHSIEKVVTGKKAPESATSVPQAKV